MALRLFNGTWQVDAYDLDRKAARTFVARNMGDTELSEQTAVAIISSIDADDGNRVMITCADMDTAHELLALNEARLEETADGIVVSIPYYQDGKHLIPLMGSISFEDERISHAITEIVRKDLEHARRQGCI